MDKTDYNKFVVLWVGTMSLYPYMKEPNDTSLMLCFNAFKEFSFEDFQKGIQLFISESTEAPVPANVKLAILKVRKEDKGSLEIKANKFYLDLSNGFSVGHDIITDDQRAVLAFKQVYRTVQSFNSVRSTDEPFRRKEFIKAYVEARKEWLDSDDIQRLNWIKGIYANSTNPLVRFIGDVEKCKRIAKEIYKYKRPRYTTLDDMARIALKRSQIEKIELSDTHVPQITENSSTSEYVDMETIQKDMEKLVAMFNVKRSA